jgi:hypothetical protein
MASPTDEPRGPTNEQELSDLAFALGVTPTSLVRPTGP